MITYGTTRVVLSVSPRTVIKVVRLRPARLLMRLIKHAFHRQVGERLQQFDEGNVWQAMLKYVFAGFYANRQEWQLSQQYPEAPIARVSRMLLWGVILVQPRGEAIVAVDRLVVNHPLWSDMVEEMGSVKGALTQFARFGGRILLVDLGWPLLSERLPLRLIQG